MVAAQVCQEMGWTYQEYLDQPQWFIDTLLAKWEVEEDKMRRESKNHR